MRRFVALPVPDDVRAALRDAIDPRRDLLGDGLRWTRPEGWHVTLAYLGEVADDDVDGVVEVVRAGLERAGHDRAGHDRAGHDRDHPRTGALPATLRLTAAGRFGRNVVWAGVADEPVGSVAALGDRLQSALAAARLPVHVQPVRPHVTLARSRRRDVDDALVDSIAVPACSWAVTHVELWRSISGDGPPRYEVDVSVALDG